ncbi:MAG TPA: redoxin domain-containing protein [bacterium]
MNFHNGFRIFLIASGLLGTSFFISGCGKGADVPVERPGGLVVGDKAADFSLMDQTGHVIKLSDTREGWYLVLIFYRGHWCSACLNQLLNLKESFPKFAALHAALAAISVDPVEDSAHFNEEWRFPFPLLTDSQLQQIDAYGARHPQGHEGKDISHPAVIIIDPNKMIRYKYVGKSPVDRPTEDEILYALQQIQKSTTKP